jgi:hypothetical protein
VHVKESTSDISQAKAIAHAFISAFESIFCAPSLGMSSLILARKPPLALLYKVTLRPSVPSLCFNLYSVNAGLIVFLGGCPSRNKSKLVAGQNSICSRRLLHHNDEHRLQQPAQV